MAKKPSYKKGNIISQEGNRFEFGNTLFNAIQENDKNLYFYSDRYDYGLTYNCNRMKLSLSNDNLDDIDSKIISYWWDEEQLRDFSFSLDYLSYTEIIEEILLKMDEFDNAMKDRHELYKQITKG